MENHPEKYLPGENGESVHQEQITEYCSRVAGYLASLYRKSSLVEEEAQRPILSVEEHTYINTAVNVSAHLLRYWLEFPDAHMPPAEALNGLLTAVRSADVKVASAPEDIAADKHLFASLLNTLSVQREHTSRLHGQINKKAIVLARELVGLMPVLAAYNGHRLPSDYSVEISMGMLTRPLTNAAEINSIALPPDLEGLKELLQGLEPDRSGYVRLDESRRLKLEAILTECGLAVEKPTPETILEGIEAARTLVGKGRAEAYLKELDFLRNDKLSYRNPDTPPEEVVVDYPIYINPDALAGANNFDDWTGRKGMLKSDDLGDKKPSLEVIIDYATRGTQLPVSEVKLIDQDSKLIVYAENSHRAAAAKLRSEPLAVNSFRIYR